MIEEQPRERYLQSPNRNWAEKLHFNNINRYTCLDRSTQNRQNVFRAAYTYKLAYTKTTRAYYEPWCCATLVIFRVWSENLCAAKTNSTDQLYPSCVCIGSMQVYHLHLLILNTDTIWILDTDGFSGLKIPT